MVVKLEDYIFVVVIVGKVRVGDGDGGVGVVGEDGEGVCCVEVDVMDGGGGDGWDGEDGVDVEVDCVLDVGCGLFVVGVVVGGWLLEFDVFWCEGFDVVGGVDDVGFGGVGVDVYVDVVVLFWCVSCELRVVGGC